MVQNAAVPCAFEFDQVIDADFPLTRHQDNAAVEDEAGKTYQTPWCPSDICDTTLLPPVVLTQHPCNEAQILPLRFLRPPSRLS